MKVGIAVVVVAAALALAGCGGDGGSKESAVTETGESMSASPSVSAAASESSTQDPSSTPTSTNPVVSAGTGADATQTVDGVWLAAAGDTKIQLELGKGKANLTSAHLCGGGYSDKDGVAITLTCMDGDKERTNGHGVLAPDGKTLTVQWVGGPTDVFSRTGLSSD